jgi:hypothetical protein
VTACQRERPSRCRLACGQSALEAPSSPRRRLRFRCSIERARVHFGRNSSNLDFISVRPVFLRRDDPVRNTEISATVAALRTSQLKRFRALTRGPLTKGRPRTARPQLGVLAVLTTPAVGQSYRRCFVASASWPNTPILNAKRQGGCLERVRRGSMKPGGASLDRT